MPLPAGASAFFFLIILGGYIFGARFGMLLGAIALFVSAFASGGARPLGAVPDVRVGVAWDDGGVPGRLRSVLARRPMIEIVVLATFGGVAGFLYGALMNLWFWPYVATGDEVSWAPGLGIVETLRHYWAFYVLTSFGWDAWAALCNVLFSASPPSMDTCTRSAIQKCRSRSSRSLSHSSTGSRSPTVAFRLWCGVWVWSQAATHSMRLALSRRVAGHAIR